MGIKNSPSNWDAGFSIVLDVLHQVVRVCLSPVAALTVGPGDAAKGATVVLVVVRLHYARSCISNRGQHVLLLKDVYIKSKFQPFRPQTRWPEIDSREYIVLFARPLSPMKNSMKIVK